MILSEAEIRNRSLKQSLPERHLDPTKRTRVGFTIFWYCGAFHSSYNL
jgi:hypothetical protein